MPILYNVRGYWRENRGTNFKSKDYWDGKMLLQDDGWFEGIAHDPESSYTGDRFIFGVCHETDIMEIYKFCPLAIASPFVYSISRRDDALRGDVFWLRDQHLYPFGDALISRSQVDPERVDVNSEIKELEESIEEYKDEKLDEPLQVCYDRIKELKDCIIKLRVIREKGHLISFEDSKELFGKFESVYTNSATSLANSLLKSYNRDLNKLILDRSTLPQETTDLPFEI